MPQLISSRFLFFSTAIPLLISILIYRLDTFDPAPIPSEAYDPLTTANPPLYNDKLLTGAELIGVGKLHKPEDIIYHQNTNLIYTGCVDGWVKRVTLHDSANDSLVEDWVNTGGRPLGLAFGLYDEVIVADADKGLLNISGDGKKIELLTEEAEGVKFKITDAVTVADDGVLYFTDASYKYNLVDYSFAVLEGRPHGRLLSFDPVTRTTRVLVKDVYFANGVTMSPDQTHLVFCETLMRRCNKYNIREGRVEPFIKGLPGYPDNIRYDGDGHYWIAMPSAVTKLWKLSMKYPFLRKIAAIAAKYGIEPMFMENSGVMQVDLDGNPVALYHDQTLTHLSTGVKIGKYLYCGSLLHSHITRLDLLKYPAERKYFEH